MVTFLVDGKRVDIPSYRVEPGQTIGVREKSRNLDIIKESIEVTTLFLITLLLMLTN